MASRNQAGKPDMPPLPFALVIRTGNALRLAAVSPISAQQGLKPGMTLADARARCPDLATSPHDPAADAAELERLAALMMRFTPMVASEPPDGLILDITGCGHLFGGDEALARLAREDAGLRSRHAIAGHAAAARALARFGASETAEQTIGSLPVAALELPQAALAGLQRAGLVTLGDLACRPMAGLAARFGADAVTRLRAILGEVERPISPRSEAAPIRAGARFAEPVRHVDDALEVIETLLGAIARQMEDRQLGGRRFAVQLERGDGARRRLMVETSIPLRDPAPVMRLLRERIEHLADPIDPGFGFDAIALAVPRTEPLAAQQVGLDGEDPLQDDVAALIDRLATRLGPDAVRRLHPQDRHIPESAQRWLPATQRPPADWTDSPHPAPPLPRPALLLDPPERITTIAEVPDGPPQQFRWRGQAYRVRMAEGPERIAPEWWRSMDGHAGGSGIGFTRDYYRVEDSAGHRFWVFRHGQFGERSDLPETPPWYLHGLFA
ncbi:Y-family DNA polymerase [Croceibacterium xixiisoli]|uniref:Y-family DNA polymerase n=1 Tax=Croceibacterium xixiisoli TaxID=1476466 RepID=UPI002E26FCB3